jgi:hypothetical protein
VHNANWDPSGTTNHWGGRQVYDTWDVNKRIAEAKRLTARLVDHAHYLLDIRENNAIVVYSDQLSKQIPRSYAANAFNVFREAMHQIEIVRL